MKVFLSRPIFLICAMLLINRVDGEAISWYSPIPQSNLTSANQEMDGVFQFQLGVFTNGFVPTASNLAEWAKNWVSAQSTTYNPTTKVFDGLFVVKSNVAPFKKGTKAYIWHRISNTTQDEWILFRHSDWTWPGTDHLTPFPLIWNTADANEVIIGEVNPAGNPFLMKSEAVVSYTQWQNAQLDTSSLQGPGDDADHDGVSNLMEFVFGTSPEQASPPPATPTTLVGINGETYLQIEVPRLQNQLVKTWVEVSGDLVSWSSGDGFLVKVADTPEMLIVRDKAPMGTGQGKRFMRLKAETEP